MEFKDWLLSEMPIGQFNLVGNWNSGPKYGYNDQDIGILTNPKAVEKIHRKWSNTKQNFDFYFLRSKTAYKQITGAGKEASPPEVEQRFGIKIEPNWNSITCLFTNNRGAEKIPMTGWMIGHRMAHAFFNDSNQRFAVFFREVERDFGYILRDVYGIDPESNKNLTSLAYALGTMKSTRDRNIFRFSEFVFELTAQYLIEGKITFNKLPRFLISRNHKAWGRSAPQGNYIKRNVDLESWQEDVDGMANKYAEWLEDIMIGFLGRIFIM